MQFLLHGTLVNKVWQADVCDVNRRDILIVRKLLGNECIKTVDTSKVKLAVGCFQGRLCRKLISLQAIVHRKAAEMLLRNRIDRDQPGIAGDPEVPHLIFFYGVNDPVGQERTGGIEVHKGFGIGIERAKPASIRSEPHSTFPVFEQSDYRIISNGGRVGTFVQIVFPVVVMHIIAEYTAAGSGNPQILIQIFRYIDNRYHGAYSSNRREIILFCIILAQAPTGSDKDITAPVFVQCQHIVTANSIGNIFLVIVRLQPPRLNIQYLQPFAISCIL